MKRKLFRFIAVLLTLAVALPSGVDAARIKDISSVAGMRENQLIGYGLMVGLKNSGDRSYKTPFTIQTLLSMLKRLGTTVDIRQLSTSGMGVSQTRQLRDVRVENVAAVMVTASLPSFARPGSKIDVQVSSLGDARSLEGGTLLLTPLKAADGMVYAVAQGEFNPATDSGSKKGRGQTLYTGGLIHGGAIVEKSVDTDFAVKSTFNILLNSPDFTTASAMVFAINDRMGEGVAKGIDGGTVQVVLPESFKGDPFGFLSEIEVLNVERDVIAKVVIDEKSGTIIIGESVEINNVAISFGGMTLEVKNPFIQQTVNEKKESLNMLRRNTDIQELVRALNALGVSPRDLVAIFRSLRSAGALSAELEIIS
ncbi:MAG: flagellar basal body P-ring protein FlgI [Nitrospinota bacterium]|nr:flagellar basal body P-ring protein FlgI [Nitrospinota bacterium]